MKFSDLKLYEKFSTIHPTMQVGGDEQEYFVKTGLASYQDMRGRNHQLDRTVLPTAEFFGIAAPRRAKK